MKRMVASGLLLLGLTFFAPVLGGAIPSFSFVQTAEAAVSVKGYFRKNGTYVQPHMRSNPDSNPYNNYSFPGNTNPYTGKTATGDPDTYINNLYNKTPSYSTPSYEPSYVPTYTPTSSFEDLYYPKSKTYTYPSNSTPAIGDPSKFDCFTGYTFNETSFACEHQPTVKTYKYPSNSTPVWNNPAYFNCNSGYELSTDKSRCFSTKPVEKPRTTTCYRQNPCTCPSGYESVGNKICVLTQLKKVSTSPSSNPCPKGFLFRSQGKPYTQFGEFWLQSPSGVCKSAIGLCGADPKYSQVTGQCTQCQEGSFLVNGECLLYAP